MCKFTNSQHISVNNFYRRLSISFGTDECICVLLPGNRRFYFLLSYNDIKHTGTLFSYGWY